MNESHSVQAILDMMSYTGISQKDLAEQLGWKTPKLCKVLKGNQRLSEYDYIQIMNILTAYKESLNFGYDKEDSLESLFGLIDGASDEEIEGILVRVMGVVKEVTNAESKGLVVQTKARYERGFSQPLKHSDNADSSSEPKYLLFPGVRISDVSVTSTYGKGLSLGYYVSKSRDSVLLSIIYRPRSPRNREEHRGWMDTEKQVSDKMIQFSMKFVDPNKYDQSKRRQIKGIQGMYSFPICYIEYRLADLPSNPVIKDELSMMFILYTEMLREMIVFRAQSNPLSVRLMSYCNSLSSIRFKDVLERESYTCENSSDTNMDHKTVTSRSTNKPYMCVEKIIPLNTLEGIDVDLSWVESNLVCLCPLCAVRLREGIMDPIKEEMIVNLFLKHREGLKESGVELSIQQLLKLYE